MNVLFLMADELSWWAPGHMGGPPHTPDLDRLVAREPAALLARPQFDHTPADRR